MALDEDAKRRIEEEERLRVEARAKAEADLTQARAAKRNKACLGCLLGLVVVFVFLYALGSNSHQRGTDQRRHVTTDHRRAEPAPPRAARKALIPIKTLDAFRTLEEAGWRRSDDDIRKRRHPRTFAGHEWYSSDYQPGHELEGYTVTIRVVCDGSSRNTASLVKEANFSLFSMSRWKASNRQRDDLIDSLFGTPTLDERIRQSNKQFTLSEADAFQKARPELDVFMQVFGQRVTSDQVLKAVRAEADRVRSRPFDFPDAKGIYVKDVIVNATAPRVVAGAGGSGSNVEILLDQ